MTTSTISRGLRAIGLAIGVLVSGGVARADQEAPPANHELFAELPPNWQLISPHDLQALTQPLAEVYRVSPYFHEENIPKDPFELQLRQQVAEELSIAAPVPEPRRRYFEPLGEMQLFFKGWQLSVRDCEWTPFGWRATVRATPIVLSSPGGVRIQVINHFVEEYESINGEIQLMGYTEKPRRGKGFMLHH